MRISTGFLDSKRKEEDRIDKKRKENREAFEAYRKMRVENGDEVTVSDFQRMRESLAGGDAFLLKDLGPGSMLTEMAKRTNEQSQLTRVAEDAKFAKNRKETQDLFNTFVLDNLNLDPTDMIGNKQKFMALFPEAKELGEEIWSRNSGKFAEAILDGRQKGVQDFHDTFLKDVHTLDEAETIMNANGVKEWKKQSIRSIMKQKQNKFNSDAESKALQLVDEFSTQSSNLRHFTPTQIENEVAGILQRAKVSKALMGENKYNELAKSVKNQLEAKISHSQTEYTDQMTKEFNALIRGQGGEEFFRHGKDGRGFNSKDTLDLYNSKREEKGLPRVDATDETYLNHMASIAIRYNSSYKANYDEQTKKNETKADAIVDKYKAALVGRGKLFAKDSSGNAAFSAMLDNGLVLKPTVSAVEITQLVIKKFPNANASGGYSQEEENSIIQLLSNYMMPVSEYKAQVMKDLNMQSNLGFQPNTDFNDQVAEDKTDYVKTMEDYIMVRLRNFTVNVDIDDPKFDAFITNLDAEFDKYIDATIDVYMKSLGAFDVFPDSGNTIEKEVAKLKAEMMTTKETIMDEMRAGERRGALLPKGSYVLPPGNIWRQGYKKMTVDLRKKIKDDNSFSGYTEVAVTDKDGRAIMAGDLIKVNSDGTIETYNPGSQGSAQVLTNIALDPKKVGTDLLQSPNAKSFGGYTSGIVGGSDRDTFENNAADIIYQMYLDLKANNNLPNVNAPSGFGMTRNLGVATSPKMLGQALLLGMPSNLSMRATAIIQLLNNSDNFPP